MNTYQTKVFVVDLDRTLIHSDILHECFFALLARKTPAFLLTPFWLLKGKSVLKDELAERVDLSISALPFREELLDYLREQKTRGRQIVLATASHQYFTEQINRHLGFLGLPQNLWVIFEDGM